MLQKASVITGAKESFITVQALLLFEVIDIQLESEAMRSEIPALACSVPKKA